MGAERPVFGTLSLYEAMADALNADPAWVDKGANITASMVYSFGPPIGRLFYLNFDHGKITEVAELTYKEERPSDYLISGSPEAWKAMFRKELKPATGIATGKLKVRGKQTYLLKNMAAFSYILDVMTNVDVAYE